MISPELPLLPTESLDALEVFVEENFAIDERLAAAALVRGDRWVVDGPRGASNPQLAWGDLWARRMIHREHERTTADVCGWCTSHRGHQVFWPCPTTRSHLVVHWGGLPGWRDEWHPRPGTTDPAEIAAAWGDEIAVRASVTAR